MSKPDSQNQTSRGDHTSFKRNQTRHSKQLGMGQDQRLRIHPQLLLWNSENRPTGPNVRHSVLPQRHNHSEYYLQSWYGILVKLYSHAPLAKWMAKAWWVLTWPLWYQSWSVSKTKQNEEEPFGLHTFPRWQTHLSWQKFRGDRGQIPIPLLLFHFDFEFATPDQ